MANVDSISFNNINIFNNTSNKNIAAISIYGANKISLKDLSLSKNKAIFEGAAIKIENSKHINLR